MDRETAKAIVDGGEIVASREAEAILTGEAFAILNAVVERVARGALGAGLTRDEVADTLEDIAFAIRDPASVAEDMSPLSQIERAAWESIGVEFDEA